MTYKNSTLLFFIFLFSLYSSDQLEPQIKTQYASIVSVLHQENEKNIKSGFVINKNGYVITTATALNTSKKIFIQNQEHETITAEIVKISKTLNLALLKINQIKNKDFLDKISYPGFSHTYKREKVIILSHSGPISSFISGYQNMNEHSYAMLEYPHVTSGDILLNKAGCICGIVTHAVSDQCILALSGPDIATFLAPETTA